MLGFPGFPVGAFSSHRVIEFIASCDGFFWFLSESSAVLRSGTETKMSSPNMARACVGSFWKIICSGRRAAANNQSNGGETNDRGLTMKDQPLIFWLVVWNMAFIFPYIGNVIIPTVTHSIIFQRGRSTTNQFQYWKFGGFTS